MADVDIGVGLVKPMEDIIEDADAFAFVTRGPGGIKPVVVLEEAGDAWCSAVCAEVTDNNNPDLVREIGGIIGRASGDDWLDVVVKLEILAGDLFTDAFINTEALGNARGNPRCTASSVGDSSDESDIVEDVLSSSLPRDNPASGGSGVERS